MLSRVADNLYWFSRYLRRAENTARLVNVATQLQLDLPRSAKFAWEPLIETIGAADAFAESRKGNDAAVTEADVVRFLLVDETNNLSLVGSLQNAREVLRTIRETVPQKCWESVNDIHTTLENFGEKGLSRRYRQEFLNRIIDGCLGVSALLTANVSHDIGYQFLRLGTAIEQADMTTRIIDTGSSGLLTPRNDEDMEAFLAMQWVSTLRSLAALQMYRRHVRQRVSSTLAFRYLLQDPEFPRSVLFCLSRIKDVVAKLPPRPEVASGIKKSIAIVNSVKTVKAATSDPKALMDRIQTSLGALHVQIHDGYFAREAA